MTKKHAYLIIAHNQVELLKCLLKALDYEHNDIYLHLDKKMQDVDVSMLESQVQSGNLVVLSNRLDVRWGDYSQIACELALLTEATKKEYAYYHLLSGVDFPLVSQKQIHAFFAEHDGTEFVQFEAEKISKTVKQRISKFHFRVKRQNKKTILDKILSRISMILQFPVDRTRFAGVEFQKGANWFSITDSLARYVVSQKKRIHRLFCFSLCADEMFLQTLVHNSPYRQRIPADNYCDNYQNILYCIDWKRGTPYEFTEADFDFLVNSGMLFARKFNWNKDSKIVLNLLEFVTKEH